MGSKRPIPVTINRSPYTRRDNLHGFTGLLKLNLRVLAPLHVGLGKIKLRKLRPYLVPRIAETSFNTAVKQAPQLIEYDYMEVVRYGDKVCVPGSSIKGAIRSRIELIALYYAKDNVNVNDFCFSVITAFRGAPIQGMHGWRHFIIWDPAVYELRDSCNPTRTGDYSVCKGCDIFGAPGLASRVFFGNFCIEKSDVVEYLDLDFGEKLEVIKANTVLQGEISFHGLKLDELGVLLIGLGWCPEINDFKPILMGKSKYRVRTIQGKDIKIRLGGVKFEAKSMKIILDYLPQEVKEKIRGIGKVIEGNKLRQLFNKAVNEATEKYPSLKGRICFSEVEVVEDYIKRGLIS